MINPEVKLIVVVGPTATGKTDIAVKLARRFDGEVVCADSRTVYRDMNIGTAKPDTEEQAGIPHHLLDIIDPDETLSAAAFKQLADAAINGIWARGKVPFLVGGSGLYIDAVIYDYDFPKAADSQKRARLELKSDDELRQLLQELDPTASESIDMRNRRRVIRAIETVGHPRNRRNRVRLNTLVIGTSTNKEVIQERITKRVEKMLNNGFMSEVRKIGEKYGLDAEAFNVIGYRAFKEVVFGDKSVEEGAADFVKGDTLLLKKQLTWFKRNKEILWLEGSGKEEALVGEFLAG